VFSSAIYQIDKEVFKRYLHSKNYNKADAQSRMS